MKKRTGRPCVVCGRGLAIEKILDGVRCLVCPDCEGDQFRRPIAIERSRSNG